MTRDKIAHLGGFPVLLDRRGQKALATKKKIRRTTGQLIVDKGMDGITVDDICKAAKVAKGTFYLHFRSKDDVILEYGYSRLHKVIELLPEIILQRSVRESLLMAVNVVVKGKQWHPVVVKLVLLKIAECYEDLHAHDLRRILLPLIELGVGRGELRNDIPSSTLASFVADTIYCGLRNWGMGIFEGELDEAIDYAVALACDAIYRPEHREFRRPILRSSGATLADQTNNDQHGGATKKKK